MNFKQLSAEDKQKYNKAILRDAFTQLLTSMIGAENAAKYQSEISDYVDSLGEEVRFF
ncbi:MAG: hypothetical protein AAF434_17275 [Pseudomonadota bacterium]